MNVSKGELYDAVVALFQIINRPRLIPQMAKYRIAKLHEALIPLQKPIEAAQQDLIQKYGSEKFHDEAKTQPAGWAISPEDANFKTFLTELNAMRVERVDLPAGIEPIRLCMLGDDPRGVEASEFAMLGPFIVEG